MFAATAILWKRQAALPALLQVRPALQQNGPSWAYWAYDGHMYMYVYIQ